jgi:hypothetical protein
MKLSISLSFLALVSATSTTSAFITVPLQASKVSRIAPLEAAKKGRWGPVVSGAVVGWALATQIATASINPQALDSFQPGKSCSYYVYYSHMDYSFACASSSRMMMYFN